MSGCKDFQDARVHVCLLGGRGGADLECLYVDNTRCDVQKLDSRCPNVSSNSAFPMCLFLKCVGFCFRKHKYQHVPLLAHILQPT